MSGNVGKMAFTVIERPPVEFDYLTPEAYVSLPEKEAPHMFGAIVHGNFNPPPRPWPQGHSLLVPLDGSPRVEVFRTPEPPVYGEEDGFQFARGGEQFFAARSLREGAGTTLASLTDEVYQGLLRLVARQGFPHILRMWNLVPAINDQQDGLERYKQFCIGRHDAFARHGLDLEDRYPSASAVGTKEGGLCVYLLAARTPGRPIENPIQVSAYRYPRQYGPRSPSFSRALVKKWNGGSTLFLSGTASITGHESRHANRIAAQTDEMLNNLRALIVRAEQDVGMAFPLAPGNTVLKAYIRRPSDYPEVRARMERHLGKDVGVLYLEADICRKELLLEMDGVVFALPAGAYRQSEQPGSSALGSCESTPLRLHNQV